MKCSCKPKTHADTVKVDLCCDICQASISEVVPWHSQNWRKNTPKNCENCQIELNVIKENFEKKIQEFINSKKEKTNASTRS